MERRIALQTIAGALGLFSLPAWANGWSADTVRTARLAPDQRALLAEIVETIIPTTDTTTAAGPGAKALNVHQFIGKIVTDCLDKQAQETFTNGLALTDDLARTTIGKPFVEGSPAQRTALLQQLSQSTEPAQKDFYALVKNLTVRGYLNSEHVMTNLTHYEMVPGRYHGCVPVKKQG